jgi:hypothetical protein
MTVKNALLIASKLPRGSQLYRLSRKGAAHVGAPPAWTSFSESIAAEGLATSALGCQPDTIVLTRSESTELFRTLSNGTEEPKIIGRVILRQIQSTGETRFETHIHTLLAELRTPEQLAARIAIIVRNLARSQLLAELIEAKLFGVTVAVASNGAKKALETKTFPVETLIEVIEDLQDVIAT